MIWFRTKDHFASPFADGADTRAWNIDIETDAGETVRIHVGQASRESIQQMLSSEQGMQIQQDEKSNCN